MMLAWNVFAANEKVDIIVDKAKWFNSPAIPLKELNSKVVFVEVFKTWQVSTDNTASFLNLINDTFKSKDFMVLGISSEQPEEVKKYIDKHNITYPIACGKSGLYDIKVDIPAMFLIIDGVVHSYDPTKKYKFNYLFTNIDNRQRDMSSKSPDDWNAERRNTYFEFFKKTYKMCVDVREAKTIADLPMDLAVKYVEKSLLPNLDESEQAALLKAYYKEKNVNQYLLKDKVSDADKQAALDVLLKCKYRPIKINETFFKMTQDGIERIVDSKKYGLPLGAPELKLKKFRNMLKNAQSNIHEVININVDELK